MINITANTTPILSGNLEWGLPEWVLWHKALVKKYNTQSVLLKKGDLIVASNPSADAIWNTEFAKTGFFSKVRNNIGMVWDYKDERKYLGMWPKLLPSNSIQAQKYDPVFTGIQIAGDVAEGIADFGSTLYKIVKWTIIIGGSIVLIVGSAYVYNTVKKIK